MVLKSDRRSRHGALLGASFVKGKLSQTTLSYIFVIAIIKLPNSVENSKQKVHNQMAKSKSKSTSNECITSVIPLKRCQNLDNKAQYKTYIYLTKIPHKENICTIINKVTFPDI